jgi:hypothetical protein
MRRACFLLVTFAAAAACDRSAGPPASTGSTVVEVRIPEPTSAPLAATAVQSAPPAPSAAPAGARFAVHPTLGLPELPVGKATRQDVEARLGAPLEVVKHGTYSTALVYNSGIEVSFCQSDQNQTLRSLTFRAPQNAYVDAGAGKGAVTLGRTTMREARRLLGDCEWQTTQDSPTWSCVYKKGPDRELWLDVKRDVSVPQFPLDEARHLDLPVVEIQVSVYGNCH